MTCAACARTIERIPANTAGVERARVNLATNTALPALTRIAGRVRPAKDVAVSFA
jgi:cation transport ATPase